MADNEDILYGPERNFAILVVITVITLSVFMYLFIFYRYSNNECVHSRSNGTTKKFCYNNNLYCNATDRPTFTGSHTVSWTGNQETLTFPYYNPVGNNPEGTTVIGICYGSCAGYTDCISMGPCYGYCTSPSNVVYLGSTPGNTDENRKNLGTVLSSLINDVHNADNLVVNSKFDPDYDLLTFTYNTNNKGPVTSTLTNGIFGSCLQLTSSDTQPPVELAVQNLLYVNQGITYRNGFDQNFITSPTQAEGLSNTWSCVDPGFIYPCNGRKWDGVSMFVYSDGTCPVPFCSYGLHHDELTDEAMSLGVKNIGDNVVGLYQVNGFGKPLGGAMYNDFATLQGNYTLGSVPNADNITDAQRISKIFPGTGGNQANYLQGNVFCGGITPGSSTNVDDYPLDSKYPTPSSPSKKYTIGF